MGSGDIMLIDRVYPQDQFEEELSDIEIVIKIVCPLCEQKPEDTFSGNCIFKDFPENYQDKQKPPESDIMFPPRIP